MRHGASNLHARAMQRSVHEIEVALRVLQALTNWRQPDQKGVEELHRILPAAGCHSLDEMACVVIQQAVEYRRQVRDAALDGDMRSRRRWVALRAVSNRVDQNRVSGCPPCHTRKPAGHIVGRYPGAAGRVVSDKGVSSTEWLVECGTVTSSGRDHSASILANAIHPAVCHTASRTI
jgi:hypothetical protein